MNLLTAQTQIVNGLVAAVKTCWNPEVIFTNHPVLPPTSEEGARPLPEAYINLLETTDDRPEQVRMTATCLDLVPVRPVRIDVEIALRELQGQSDPVRLQMQTRAQQLRSAVLMDGSVRRLFAGEPAYWSGETPQQDEFDEDPQADDCLLRVRFYFVVTVELA